MNTLCHAHWKEAYEVQTETALPVGAPRWTGWHTHSWQSPGGPAVASPAAAASPARDRSRSGEAGRGTSSALRERDRIKGFSEHVGAKYRAMQRVHSNAGATPPGVPSGYVSTGTSGGGDGEEGRKWGPYEPGSSEGKLKLARSIPLLRAAAEGSTGSRG